MNTEVLLIISVKEARKFLGIKSKNYSDEEIEKLIQDLDGIALEYLKLVPNDIIIRDNITEKSSK